MGHGKTGACYIKHEGFRLHGKGAKLIFGLRILAVEANPAHFTATLKSLFPPSAIRPHLLASHSKPKNDKLELAQNYQQLTEFKILQMPTRAPRSGGGRVGW